MLGGYQMDGDSTMSLKTVTGKKLDKKENVKVPKSTKIILNNEVLGGFWYKPNDLRTLPSAWYSETLTICKSH